MRQIKFAVALLAATALASCGGGGGGDQSTKVKFSSQVSFGDSLSDVGTYEVGTVAALGGGKYTVNNVGTDGKNASKNWTELMAAQFGLPAPCSAETGLLGLASQGFSVPVVAHAGCTSYAQGGARVTDPVGPGNALLGGSNAVLGQLTVPVLTQIQTHLAANGGSFKGDEIVFVMAGGNDVFMQLATLSATATATGTAAGTAAVNSAISTQVNKDIAAGTCTPTDAQASNCVVPAEGELWQASLGSTAAVNAAVAAQVSKDVTAGTCTPTDAQASNCVTPAVTELVTAYLTALGNAAGLAAGNAYASGPGATAAVTAMGQAGAELAGYVNTLIVGKGAKYVTVVNLPDVSKTPFALSTDASTQTLITSMVTTFNSQLQSGLNASASVLYVDAYTVSRDQATNPAPYGLTNVTSPACDLSAAKNALGSSLVCNKSNLVAGVTDNYQFADSVHPTPYGYLLLARYVSKEMAVKGWL